MKHPPEGLSKDNYDFVRLYEASISVLAFSEMFSRETVARVIKALQRERDRYDHQDRQYMLRDHLINAINIAYNETVPPEQKI